MTICGPIEPCGLSDCEALEFVQALLPRGRLWQIGNGSRPVFDGFWHTVAQMTGETSRAICAEWGESNPCTASRNLARWAKIYGFPIDCVCLSSEKLCEWINLVGCAGRCDFIARLLGFVGLDGLEVKIEGGCEVPLSDTIGLITISGPSFYFEPSGEIPADCLVIPQVECLRARYFPAGIPVKYIPR